MSPTPVPPVPSTVYTAHMSFTRTRAQPRPRGRAPRDPEARRKRLRARPGRRLRPPAAQPRPRARRHARRSPLHPRNLQVRPSISRPSPVPLSLSLSFIASVRVPHAFFIPPRIAANLSATRRGTPHSRAHTSPSRAASTFHPWATPSPAPLPPLITPHPPPPTPFTPNNKKGPRSASSSFPKKPFTSSKKAPSYAPNPPISMPTMVVVVAYTRRR